MIRPLCDTERSGRQADAQIFVVAEADRCGIGKYVLRLLTYYTAYTCTFIIRLEVTGRLQPNIGFTLRGDLAVFMRWAITTPKVNRFE